MLRLSGRTAEKNAFPDRVTEWASTPTPTSMPTPTSTSTPTPPVETNVSSSVNQFQQLVDRRLEIAELGLLELRHYLHTGALEDAETVLDKLHEDLQMLRQRMRRETTKANPSLPGDGANACPGLPRRSR